MFDKIKTWLLKLTPLGKITDFLDGKKQMLASLAAAFVATGTIIAKFSEQGMPYLIHVAGTPEFAAASVGWIGFFSAIKGEKIRSEIAQAQTDTVAEVKQAQVDTASAVVSTITK